MTGNKYKELSDDLLYLKDVDFHEKSIKEELLSYSQLSSKLENICDKNYYENGKNLENEIEVFTQLIYNL